MPRLLWSSWGRPFHQTLICPSDGNIVVHGCPQPPGMAHTPLVGLPYFHIPGQFNGDAAAGGIPAYYPPKPGHGGVYAAGGYPGAGHFNGGCSGFQGCRAPTNAQAQPPYSNIVKRYANWNVCYSCSFDIANGHTNMSCPPHLCKATHQIGFNCQNAQQYIYLGYP